VLSPTPAGLVWSRLRDPGCGMIVAWAILAGLVAWCAFAAYYNSQVK
jgi:hypothetical protein